MGLRLGLGPGLTSASTDELGYRLLQMLLMLRPRLVMHLPVDILHAAAILIPVLVALLIFLQPDEPRDLPLQVLRQIFIEDVNYWILIRLIPGLAAIAELLPRGGIVLGEVAVLPIERREDSLAPAQIRQVMGQQVQAVDAPLQEFLLAFLGRWGLIMLLAMTMTMSLRLLQLSEPLPLLNCQFGPDLL